MSESIKKEAHKEVMSSGSDATKAATVPTLDEALAEKESEDIEFFGMGSTPEPVVKPDVPAKAADVEPKQPQAAKVSGEKKAEEKPLETFSNELSTEDEGEERSYRSVVALIAGVIVGALLMSLFT